jgi:antitoxin component YwqK of YwqJK toxin-antitoxin module
MKKTIFLLVAFALIFSCKNKETDDKKNKEENLVEVKNGIFTEWYPGKKQIKFQGGQDDLGKRDGKWTFYAENGIELSFTLYDHGKKEGFSLVKYPNGRIHYRGEYQNDQMIGLWTTYDEKGSIVSEKDFGERK